MVPKLLVMERSSSSAHYPAPLSKAVDSVNVDPASEDDLLVLGDLPCDSFLAIEALRAQFPLPGPPLLLKSQVYNILKDRTAVDRELDQLRRQNTIRMFKLLSGKDDYALLPTAEYVSLAYAAKEALLTKKGETEPDSVFDRFVTRLLPACYDVSVSKAQLQQYLVLDPKLKLNESDITLLVNAGLLILRGIDTFWFSIPSIGPSLKSCIQGRQEIITRLKRQKWRELLLKDLEKKKLRSSELGVQFHLKDLLGQGTLESLPTTVGNLIRLVDKEAK